MKTTIKTSFGPKAVVRRFPRPSFEYYETTPTPSAPNGEFWVLNDQKGFLPVASNNRALLHALKLA